MIDVLLPRTDAGVAAQIIAVTVLFAAVTWWVRGNRDIRLFAIGLWLMTYAAIGVRTLH